MKRICVLMIGLLGMVACKKESPNAELTEREYKVTFNVKSLRQTSESARISKTASLSSDSVAENFYRITYLAYNESHVLVDSTSQYNNGNTGFRSIPSALAPGKYTIVFIGSESNFLLEDIGNLNSVNLVFPQDVFLAKTEISVTDKNVVKSIALEKVSGKLRIDIEDKLPENVDEIHVAISNAPDKLLINTGMVASVAPLTLVLPVEKTDLQKTHKIIETDVLASETPLTWVIITLLDKGKNILAQKTINNVVVERNSAAVLSAKLF